MTENHDTQKAQNDGRIRRPGFGLPINLLPDWRMRDEEWLRYPHAIADTLESKGVTVRERRMLEFMNQITDKPEWDRKVFDETIVQKWHDEACKHNEELKDLFLSEDMFKYCIAELRDKTERLKKLHVIPVLDAEVTIVKSDTIVPAGLVESLKEGVKPLENIPDNEKDWHPGSEQMVLDLVHPSMCALAYGQSYVIPEGAIPLKKCLKFCGRGELLKKPEGDFSNVTMYTGGWGNSVELPAFGSFQWLPAEIGFREDGTASIGSYINSLHPTHHAGLYPVLEKFVDCAVPLWNEALSWFHSRVRIEIDGTGDEDFWLPDGLEYDGPKGHYEGQWFHEDEAYLEWRARNRILIQREPKEFKSYEDIIKDAKSGARPVDLRQKFKDSGLQIIFKLANIHLTPEKPEYEGGTWHVEGALNEHICATAIYYYEQENITDSYLSFRQFVDAEDMTMKPMQDEWASLEQYFGVENDGPIIQELGKVLTREGRMLAFPNVLQHRVGSFRLKDETKPGHRKLLVMFLVDPHIQVLSTANVPPQQKAWFQEEIQDVERLGDLPPELYQKVIDGLDRFPFDYEAQCRIRDELMAERGRLNEQFTESRESETFSFCEH